MLEEVSPILLMKPSTLIPMEMINMGMFSVFSKLNRKVFVIPVNTVGI